MKKVAQQLPGYIDDGKDPLADQIFEKICSSIRHQYGVLKSMKERCTNKTVTIYDMVPFDVVEANNSDGRLVFILNN